ncbi:Zn-dependent hydrolases of the beta-lactamase protein [Penicillium sp. IBT 16267x]|nr:Zn-dependent hydrolases of the beta-lactamase protein [Penicillium sp. IBT 16267x]
MSPSTFKSSLNITHIGTATAIFEIDGVNFLTDPFFSPAGTTWDMGGGSVLRNTETPALSLENLPPIDAILLSHEDHPDNLDEIGRQLLNGRHVFTTVDGGKKLSPRPAVRGMKPWETTSVHLGGKKYEITATPCQHLPGGECTGFILETEEFGVHTDGRPNAIYFSGDTVYFDELAKITEKYHVVVAVMNLGSAHVALPDGMMQITMDGKQAAQLFRAIKADYLVPMHYESWGHFRQLGKDLVKEFEEEGISEKVRWLTPGKSVKIL